MLSYLPAAEMLKYFAVVEVAVLDIKFLAVINLPFYKNAGLWG